MAMDVEYYLKKITSAHCDQPKYMEWLRVLLKVAGDCSKLIESIPFHFSLMNAVGKQLDLIGSMFGVSRVMVYTADAGPLNDDDFRDYIRAQILRAQWDGQNGGLYALWQSIYPEYSLTFTDNMDMSIHIQVMGDMSPALTEMIQAGMILPVPMGVSVTYTVIAFVIPPSDVKTGVGLYGAGEHGIDRQVD